MAVTWRRLGQEIHSGSSGRVPTLREVGTKAGGWFPTPPLVFQAVAISKGPPNATIHGITSPVWIYPPFKTVALWVFVILCAAGLIYLLWRISRHVHRAIILRRMSPRERALYELNELLARDLVARKQIKEFYLELLN